MSDIEFKTGDIFCDATGFSGDAEGNSYIGISLFEYDESGGKGEGFVYSNAGTRYGYRWAHPSKEKQIKNIPDDVLYSFKHGSHHINIDESKFKNIQDWVEVIRESDFKFVKKNDVIISSIIEGVKTIEDVKDNWVLIKKYGIPLQIATLCLEYIGVKIPPVVNGEIGLHSLYMNSRFHENFYYIDEAISNIK